MAAKFVVCIRFSFSSFFSLSLVVIQTNRKGADVHSFTAFSAPKRISPPPPRKRRNDGNERLSQFEYIFVVHKISTSQLRHKNGKDNDCLFVSAPHKFAMPPPTTAKMDARHFRVIKKWCDCFGPITTITIVANVRCPLQSQFHFHVSYRRRQLSTSIKSHTHPFSHQSIRRRWQVKLWLKRNEKWWKLN